MDLFARVFHNGDHACIVWGPNTNPRSMLKDCLGFAIRRNKKDADPAGAETLSNFTSFQANQTAHSAPSSQWPVQKFYWWDYARSMTDADPDAYVYKVVAMGGTPGALTEMGIESDWTSPATLVSGDCGDGISCYFNRGIVASQWVARALEAASGQPAGGGKVPLTPALQKSIGTPGNALRDELGGVLKKSLLALLDKAHQDGKSIFAALYELNDPELIDRLQAFGPKANIILANGAFSAVKPDENKAARDLLRGQTDPAKKVNLFDRMVSEGHFAHNKFVVFCDATGKPQSVWTGSTNWTMTGLCTQANNGLLLEDSRVADAFMQQWERLHEAGNGFPDALKSANSQQKQFTMGNSTVTTWFVPTNNQEDLQHARRLINGAQDGILFLMFEPGGFEVEPGKWTLLQTILNRHQLPPNPYNNPNLLIRGVVNQEIPNLTMVPNAPLTHADLDPTKATHPIALFDGGSNAPTRLTDEIEVPAAVKSKMGHWDAELLNQGVKIYSKLIVIDPFGAHPVVMTGSHNMGYKASSMNDDNLVIIEGNSTLAQAYAANCYSVYQQYRDNAASTQPGWGVLQSTDQWQAPYLQNPHLADLEFMLKVMGA